MYKWTGIFAGLLWVSVASAQPEIILEAATGVFYNKESNLLLLGVTTPARPFLKQKSYHQLNIGGWDGPRSATFVGFSKGFQWDLPNTTLRVSTGASLISQTSDRLSTAFQFYEQFMINFRLSKSASLGLSYRHWSNANIKLPNDGMDFAGIQTELKW